VRIAHLVSQYPAPSHTFIRREVLALRARGIDVHTFSVRSGECISDDDESARAETFYILPARPLRVLVALCTALLSHPRRAFDTLLEALRHRVPGSRALAWSLFYFLEAMVLAHELQRRKIKHVHNHFANAGANVGYLASRFLGLPWSLTLHGISETDYPAGVILPDKILAARFVVCASYFGLAQAMRLVPHKHWGKMFVGRCGLDLKALPVRAREANPRPRLVCVGRLSAEKGHFGLLEAFKAVRNRGVDAELVLVGDGPERERIEDVVSALDLVGHVQLLGRLPADATLNEIARSDLLVLASFMEGLPVVLMEAMALGLPVISSRVAGVPELVEHGVEGLLFTPGKWSELTETLHTLLSNQQLREQMGKAGRSKVEHEFEIGRAVEPLARHLAETAAGVPRLGDSERVSILG
jgi:colanic acid/amylovoran biosynthesis glycosyltransferase